MAGFNVMDMLNKTSKEGIEEKPKARFRTKDIDIYNIYANEDNISDQIGIDEKADRDQTSWTATAIRSYV